MTSTDVTNQVSGCHWHVFSWFSPQVTDLRAKSVNVSEIHWPVSLSQWKSLTWETSQWHSLTVSDVPRRVSECQCLPSKISDFHWLQKASQWQTVNVTDLPSKWMTISDSPARDLWPEGIIPSDFLDSPPELQLLKMLTPGTPGINLLPRDVN